MLKKGNNLKEIKQAFLNGESVDWNSVYADKKPYTVSLPTTIYHEKKCWYTYKNEIFSTFDKLVEQVKTYVSIEWHDFDDVKIVMSTLNKYEAMQLLNIFHEFHFLEKANENIDVATMIHKMSISDNQKRLFMAILDIFEQMNLLKVSDGVVHTLDEIESFYAISSQNEVDNIRDHFLKEWPSYSAYLLLLDKCLINMKDILQGNVLGTSVVFSSEDPDLLSNIYKNNNYIDKFHNIISNAIYYDILLIREKEGTNRKINILEIGSGTGGASAGILKKINGILNISYYYTDISKSLVEYGKKTYGNYDFVVFQKFNIEKDIVEQNLKYSSFDIVIAYDVLHATQNMNDTLCTIKQLLRKNGKLFIMEPTAKQNYSTLTFGVLNGWWNYEDEEIRIPHSPLVSEKNWGYLLNSNGFNKSYFFTDERAFESIIICESDGVASTSKKTHNKSIITNVESVQDNILSIWKQELGDEKIDINDNYFELGGDSIIALSILKDINESFGIDMKISELMNYQTVKELGGYIESEYLRKEHKSKLSSKLNLNLFDKYCIEKNKYKSVYKITPAQKRIYIVNKINGNSVINNLPKGYEINGIIDLEKIREAFTTIVDRHEALRTNIVSYDDDVVQVIHKENKFHMEIEKNENADIYKELDKFVKPFDLENDCLFRCKIIQVSDNKAFLLIDMHHVISDGFSIQIIIKEFIVLYTGRNLEPVRYQYKDFAICEAEYSESDEYQKEKVYWLSKMSLDHYAIDFPTDFARKIDNDRKGDIIEFEFDQLLYHNLKKIAVEKKTSLYNVCLAAFFILLHRYSNQKDMTVGTVNAGRTEVEFNDIIGMFVNTICLNVQLDYQDSFDDFLNLVKKETKESFENQRYQFEQMVEDLKYKRDNSHNPFFDIMFIMQNMGDFSITVDNLTIKDVSYNYKLSKFDFTMLLTESDDNLKGSIEYCSNLFKASSINRLIDEYKFLLNELTLNSSLKISDYDILPEYEKKMILNKFNESEMIYKDYPNVVEMIRDNMEKYSDKKALCYHDRYYSYQELNEKSNMVSHMLIAHGVEKGDVVGIIIDKSDTLIFSILGAMKIGAPYLIIDTEYPTERIEYMLQDSGCKYILTNNKYQNKFSQVQEYTVEDCLNGNKTENVNISLTKSDLLYIIYTSGSSGKPKGVMVEHRGLVNYRNHCIRDLKLNDKCKILAFASPSFDAFESEMLMAFSLGGELHLTDKNILRDPELLTAYLISHDIDTLTLPPVLAEKMDFSKIKIKTLLTAGSEVKPSTVEKLKDNVHYYNAYGPTEDSICTTIWEYKEYDSDSVPIGKPIPNHRVYILNSINKLSPIGVPGELCVSGEGLARGYLNRPDLTLEKFVVNPYTNEKMYRTGDLARWLDDGNIEYLGRVDNQIKLRGFRIELGEIENVLVEMQGVQEAAIIIEEDENGPYLVAYYTSTDKIEENEIRSHLRKTLPMYMIPAQFVKIDYIPLTINGKFDKTAVPSIKNTKSAEKKLLSDDPDEIAIIQVIEKIIGHSDYSLDDNLFDIGLDSIRVIQLSSQLKELGYDISVGELFVKPYISEIIKSKRNCKIELDKEMKNEKNTDGINDIIQNILICNQKNHAVLKEQKVVKRYNKRMINEIFMNKNVNTGSILSFTSEKSMNDIKLSILQVVKANEIFFTTWTSMCFEVKKTIDINIPNFAVDPSLADFLIKEMFMREHNAELPYEIALFDFGNNRYKLVLVINHAIYDGFSNDLFICQVKNAISGVCEKEIIDYSSYVNEISKAIDLNKAKQIVDYFNISKFQSLLKMKNYDDDAIKGKYSYPLQSNKDIINQIIEKIMYLNNMEFDNSEVPVWLLFNNRSSKNDDFNKIIGNCLDIIPIIASKKTTHKDIDERIAILKKENITFLDLYNNLICNDDNKMQGGIVLNIISHVNDDFIFNEEEILGQTIDIPGMKYYLIHIGKTIEMIV